MNLPIALDAQIYFREMALISRELRRKMLDNFQFEVNCTMEGIKVQLLRKACDATPYDFFVWATWYCDTAVLVIQSFGDTV